MIVCCSYGCCGLLQLDSHRLSMQVLSCVCVPDQSLKVLTKLSTGFLCTQSCEKLILRCMRDLLVLYVGVSSASKDPPHQQTLSQLGENLREH